jgi:hypothetical protein
MVCVEELDLEDIVESELLDLGGDLWSCDGRCGVEATIGGGEVEIDTVRFDVLLKEREEDRSEVRETMRESRQCHHDTVLGTMREEVFVAVVAMRRKVRDSRERAL